MLHRFAQLDLRTVRRSWQLAGGAEINATISGPGGVLDMCKSTLCQMLSHALECLLRCFACVEMAFSEFRTPVALLGVYGRLRRGENALRSGENAWTNGDARAS